MKFFCFFPVQKLKRRSRWKTSSFSFRIYTDGSPNRKLPQNRPGRNRKEMYTLKKIIIKPIRICIQFLFLASLSPWFIFNDRCIERNKKCVVIVRPCEGPRNKITNNNSRHIQCRYTRTYKRENVCVSATRNKKE